jgi:hypothetical protein
MPTRQKSNSATRLPRAAHLSQQYRIFSFTPEPLAGICRYIMSLLPLFEPGGGDILSSC